MNAFADWLNNDRNFVLFLSGAVLLGAVLGRWSVRYLRSCRVPVGLSSRGEEAGVPEEPEAEPETHDEAIDALIVALQRPEVLFARFKAVAESQQLKDLRRLPQQIQGYYVMEADR